MKNKEKTNINKKTHIHAHHKNAKSETIIYTQNTR